VVVAAFRAGLTASLLSAVSGALAFDLLQTKPYGSLRIAGTRDTATTVLLLAVGVVAGIFEERERAVRRREGSARSDFAHVQRFARLCAAGENVEDLTAAAEAELADLLGLRHCRFEPIPFDTTLTRLDRRPGGRHKLVLHQEEAAPPLGSNDEVELAVRARGHQLGRFVLGMPRGGFPLLIPLSAREVAFALVDQLGTTLASAWAAAPVAAGPPPSAE
jgi:hypothetical protein